LFKLNTLKTFMALLAFSALIWVSPASTFAAANDQIIMVLDGMSGESTSGKYKDGINILTLAFGASNADSGSTPGQAGKATYSDINFIKNFDSSSLPLLKNLATGKSIANGTIYFFNNSSDQPYLVIRLKKILVKSYQLSSNSGSTSNDSVSLSYSAIEFEYTPMIQGKPGPKQTLDIDISGNVTK
jgi:type VI secretion system secreted protein Hcp